MNISFSKLALSGDPTTLYNIFDVYRAAKIFKNEETLDFLVKGCSDLRKNTFRLSFSHKSKSFVPLFLKLKMLCSLYKLSDLVNPQGIAALYPIWWIIPQHILDVIAWIYLKLTEISYLHQYSFYVFFLYVYTFVHVLAWFTFRRMH